jgi:hypothetical protein
MRVTSPLPRMIAPAADRAPAASGEFRAALRTAGERGAADRPADAAERGSGPERASDPHADNAMAPAAAQAALLAAGGAGARVSRSRTPTAAPGVPDIGGDPAQRAGRHARTTLPAGAAALKTPATPASIADAVDAFTAGALGDPGAQVGADRANGANGANAADAAPHAAASDDGATTPPNLREAGTDPATAAMLRAAYGIVVGLPPSAGGAATATTAAPRAATAGKIGPTAAHAATAASAARGPDSVGDSPVAVWTAAAIGRAIGSIGSAGGSISGAAARPGQAGLARAAAAMAATGATAAGNANAANPASAAAAEPAAGDAAPTAGAAFAMTPLEQAVHELVGRIAVVEPGAGHARAARPLADDATSDRSQAAGLTGIAAPLPQASAHAGPAAATADATGAAGRAAGTTQLPEPPANPSHVHLVIDDGPERVVATVAIRGSEVHVALRATDDATAAALARNAGSLDQAMHRRGLALHDMSTEREPRDQRPSQDAEPRERRPRDDPRFELEESP